MCSTLYNFTSAFIALVSSVRVLHKWSRIDESHNSFAFVFLSSHVGFWVRAHCGYVVEVVRLHQPAFPSFYYYFSRKVRQSDACVERSTEKQNCVFSCFGVDLPGDSQILLRQQAPPLMATLR